MQIMVRTEIKANLVHVVLVWTAVLMFILVSDGHAYVYQYCAFPDNNNVPIKWNGSTTTMFIFTDSFPIGSSQDHAIQNAMWHWNNVKGSNFQFGVAYSPLPPVFPNSLNEMNFDSGLSDDTLAVATWLPPLCSWTCPDHVCDCSCYICPPRPPFPWECSWQAAWMEADIQFNSNKIWTTEKYDYSKSQGPPYNLEAVALHELGHVLGLSTDHHEDRFMATMNSYYPNGGPLGYSAEWDPLADDRAGIRFLYGNGATEIDIAASNLKRIGAGTSGIVDGPNPSNNVAPGATVAVEYTISNQGTSAQTFNVGFYLSPDTDISTSDILIGNISGVSMAPGTSTFTRSVMIPYGTPSGTYYIGFIVDNNNALAENNENNNFQYIPQAITIPLYTVYPSAGPNGSISPAVPQTVYYGSTTSFTVSPDYGYHIASVTGCNGTLNENTYTTGAVTANCTVSATFAINYYTITATAGSGGIITPTSASVRHGDSQIFMITPNTGYHTVDVKVDGISQGPILSYTFTAVSAPHTIEAVFSNKYSITVRNRSFAGSGTVTSSPGGLSCGATCSADFIQDSTTTLTPTPDTGSLFAGWTGDCSGTGNCTLTMNSDKKATAGFTFISCSSLPTRISKGGAYVYYSSLQNAYAAAVNGDVIQSMALNFPENLNVNRDIAITLAGGYDCGFNSIVDYTSLLGMTTSAGVLTISDVEIVSTIPDYTYTLVSFADAGGSISPSGTVNVYRGASQSYILTPNTGYQLLDVLVDGASVGAVTTYTFGNITANHTIQAIFSRALTIAKAGTGSGTITSSPAGLTCGSTTCTGPFSYGTVVTLTAAPAAGSSFAGWSGSGCSGTDTCTVTMNADTIVTATFNTIPPVADFSGTPTSGIETITVNCIDLSVNNPTSWLWNFGDGATSTLQNPSHTYNAIGTYNVSLAAINSGGTNTNSKTGYIVVQPCPNQPVRIAGTTPVYYPTLQAAYDAAADGAVIQSRNLQFTENLSVNRNVSVTLQGGYVCDYSATSGVTNLKGMITTSAGTLTIKDFVLQQ